MPVPATSSPYPLVVDPPFVVLLLLLSAGIGRRLLLTLRCPKDELSPVGYGALATALGLGCLQYLPFALGLTGWLTPAVIWSGFALLTVLFGRDVWAVARAGVVYIRSVFDRRWRAPLWSILCAAVTGGALTLALLQALSPPTDLDGLGYHLAAPRQWLLHHDLHYLPGYVHTNSPMGVEMLFTLAMAVWSDTAAKLIHFSFGVMTLIVTFELGRMLRGWEVGLAAAVLFVAGIPKYSAAAEFGWAYVDLGLACFTCCAVLAFLQWQRTEARGWLHCSALCAGFAMSAKLQGAVVVLALAAVALDEVRFRGAPTRAAAAAAAGFAGIGLLMAAPWLVRAWALTGNPVFPFLPSIFPTRDWSPATGAAYHDFNHYYLWGGSAGTGLPFGARKFLRIVSAAIAINLFGALFWQWKERAVKPLLAVACAGVLAGVVSSGLYMRYLMPFLPVILLLACIPADRLLRQSRFAQAAIVGMTVLGAAAYVRLAEPGPKEAALAALGITERQAFLDRRLPGIPVARYVNERLPQHAVILFDAPGGTYYIDQQCMPVEPLRQYVLRMDDWETFLNDLRRNRVGYALVSSQPPANDDLPGIDYAPLRNHQPFLRRLIQEHGVPLYSAGDAALFQLRL